MIQPKLMPGDFCSVIKDEVDAGLVVRSGTIVRLMRREIPPNVSPEPYWVCENALRIHHIFESNLRREITQI